MAARSILEPALIITPFRLASKAATDLADRVAIDMEYQAQKEDNAERFSILDQPAEFKRYIWDWHQVIATLASWAAISGTSGGSSCLNNGQKP